jgi:T5orf172 domain
MRLWLSGPRILGIRPGVTFRRDELFEKPKQRKSASSGSFIYVVQADNGMLKIGVSTNPGARLAQLRASSPFKLSFAYMGALRCDGYAMEAAAHETLSRHRLGGEWFNCPVDMAVAAIGAAAYRLGEPIASGDPKFADEIVRMINETAAAPKRSWPWRGIAIAIGAAAGAIIAADFIFRISS